MDIINRLRRKNPNYYKIMARHVGGQTGFFNFERLDMPITWEEFKKKYEPEEGYFYKLVTMYEGGNQKEIWKQQFGESGAKHELERFNAGYEVKKAWDVGEFHVECIIDNETYSVCSQLMNPLEIAKRLGIHMDKIDEWRRVETREIEFVNASWIDKSRLQPQFELNIFKADKTRLYAKLPNFEFEDLIWLLHFISKERDKHRRKKWASNIPSELKEIISKNEHSNRTY